MAKSTNTLRSAARLKWVRTQTALSHGVLFVTEKKYLELQREADFGPQYFLVGWGPCELEIVLAPYIERPVDPRFHASTLTLLRRR